MTKPLPSTPQKRMIRRLLFAALAGIALPSALHAEDILLGASVQLTGSTANTGRYYRDGYEFAIDKINAAGGVQVGKARQEAYPQVIRQPIGCELECATVRTVGFCRQGELLAWPFRQQFWARGLRDLGEIRNPNGAGWRRLGSDLRRGFKY